MLYVTRVKREYVYRIVVQCILWFFHMVVHYMLEKEFKYKFDNVVALRCHINVLYFLRKNREFLIYKVGFNMLIMVKIIIPTMSKDNLRIRHVHENCSKAWFNFEYVCNVKWYITQLKKKPSKHYLAYFHYKLLKWCFNYLASIL